MSGERQIRQYAICLGVLCLIAYGSAIWSRRLGLWSCAGGPVSIADFVLYYMLGSLACGPHHLELYDPKVQLQWQNQMLHPCNLERVFYCQYFPLVVPAVALLSWFPLGVAYYVWAILQLLLLALLISWFLRNTTNLSARARRLFVLGVLTALPAVDNFHLGQVSGIITCAAFVYCWGILRGRAAGGLGLALLTWKVQIFFPLAAISLLAKRWQLIAVAFAAAMALLGVSALLIGWHNLIGYPSLVLHADQLLDVGVNPPRMTSLRGVLSIALGNALALKISLAVFAAALLAGCLLWLKTPMRGQADLRWRMAMIFVGALLVSPHTHLHDCLLLSVPAALTLPELLTMSGRSKGQNFWTNTFLLYPILSWLCFVPPLIDVPSIYTAGTCLLLGALLIAAYKCRLQALS